MTFLPLISNYLLTAGDVTYVYVTYTFVYFSLCCQIVIYMAYLILIDHETFIYNRKIGHSSLNHARS